MLGPFPRLLIMIGNALTPGKGFTDGPFATEAELRELVDLAEASEVIESGERRMIHSVFDLGNTIAREVMVPRTDMVFIEEYKTLRQAVSLALRSGFSRIPVVREGLDDVVGVLYLKDVIKRIYDLPASQSTERVGSVVRQPVWCPDSKPVDELLQEMQLKRVHVVIVVDEFGGTAGMVTIEDILEEIVGEITDEYDEENTNIVELGEGRFRVSSRLPVDELGDLFGLKLDDEDVETVGGLMAKQLNKVPIAGSVVKYDGLELVAERASGRRNQVGTVIATKIEDHEHPPTRNEPTPRPDWSPSRRCAPDDGRSLSRARRRAERPRGPQDHHPGPIGPSADPGGPGRLRTRHRRPHLRRDQRTAGPPEPVGRRGRRGDGRLLRRGRSGSGGRVRRPGTIRGRPGGGR